MTNGEGSNGPEWAKGLHSEQRVAASHDGKNALLLAGPGTGKTFTLKARVEFLIFEKNVQPSAITALTFTRAAAGELRGRVNLALEGKFAERPFITTLHSFALQTLLRNSKLCESLPQPLRVADDWEERCIVREDLKGLISENLKTVKERLLQLSADWETLRADDETPNDLKADPKFVGAWQKHRSVYGYTLRSELVYQLKRAMEQQKNIKLHSEIQYLLVDEYQDLNACDLSVIRRVADMGASVYAAGDDDQSIYGFRHASPQGIRTFGRDFAPSADLPLATCVRCDHAIMGIARWVADLDPQRLPKPWRPRDNAGPGEVKLIRFDNGDEEASGIASLSRFLIEEEGYKPDEILILIRSDKDRAFSKFVSEYMATAGVPFYLNVDSASPLYTDAGRVLLSFLRLAVDENDSLAWRTLLQIRKNGVGEKTIKAVTEEALQIGAAFSAVLKQAAERKKGYALEKEYSLVQSSLANVKSIVGDSETVLTKEQLQAALAAIVNALVKDGTDFTEAAAHIGYVADNGGADSFKTLLALLAMANAAPEQELAQGAVNMLTMHKAKGLSSRAVIVMTCEDQYIPGRYEGGPEEGDERRLLYVSLTRAKQRLYITYAERRTGQQMHMGRDPGKSQRRLTRYLKDAPLHPVPATKFFSELAKDH